ncbi:MAG: HEAT repeat domain-containing protein [Verrucomicrobiota bacterium]
MKTTTNVWLGASALLAFVVALVCLRSKPAEPSYQGKSLSEWVGRIPQITFLEFNLVPDSNMVQVAEALRAIGTNALPELLVMLDVDDSIVHKLIRAINRRQHYVKIPIGPEPDESRLLAMEAFTLLGAIAKPAIPQLVARLDGSDKTYPAAAALASIGPDAHPQLLQALRHTNSAIRGKVAAGIGWSEPKGAFAVPSLISMLEDQDKTVRMLAVWALGRIKSDPEKTIPALIKVLADPDTEVAWRAIYSLGQFGTNAAPALPALQQLQTRPNLISILKSVIESAIKQISPPPPPARL